MLWKQTDEVNDDPAVAEPAGRSGEEGLSVWELRHRVRLVSDRVKEISSIRKRVTKCEEASVASGRERRKEEKREKDERGDGRYRHGIGRRERREERETQGLKSAVIL
jgi:hypothetical protein